MPAQHEHGALPARQLVQLGAQRVPFGLHGRVIGEQVLTIR
jgi:hypothetical protein